MAKKKQKPEAPTPSSGGRTFPVLIGLVAVGAALTLGYTACSSQAQPDPKLQKEVAELRSEIEEIKKRLDAGSADSVAELKKEMATLQSAVQQQVLVSGVYYDVVEVVDGDTFVIFGGWKVRLLGVNTPESVDPSTGVQWYGIEASDHLKKLLGGKKIRLEPEKGEQLGTGAYNRVLAYGFLEDGTDVNAAVVRGGYGDSYLKYPCGRREEFSKLQAEAKAKKLGKWNDKARKEWESTHIIPDVPAEEAKIIVTRASGTVHDIDCGRAPAKGIYFESVEQAQTFRFTKLHTCLKDKPPEKENQSEQEDGK